MSQDHPRRYGSQLSHSLIQLGKLTRALIPPHTCLLCATKSQEHICSDCQSHLISPRYYCQRCRIPLKHHCLLCGECLKHPPAFDDSYSPYLYQAPLDKLINDFKHKNNLVTGKGISVLFCKAVYAHYKEQHLGLPQWILPVPLHWRRQWQRGFNQAAFLSTELGQQLDIKVFKHATKNKYTASQEGLSRKQRLQNLRNSFSITQKLNGDAIAIVDDVMTTGATANSLAYTLKKAGAGKVSVWTVARTPKKTIPDK